MNDIDEFVTLLRDGLGLPVEPGDVELTLDEVPGWDSLHLLWIVTAMEDRTGRRVALPDVLEAPSLAGIYALYAAA